MSGKMKRIRKLPLIALLVILAGTMTMPAAEAGELSMATGLVTVNGHPQGNITVTGFGSAAETGEDGQYLLKFEPQGYGVITATYNGYNVSSGLILLSSAPMIKVKDLDIVVPVSDGTAIPTDAGEEVPAGPSAEPVWVGVPPLQAANTARQTINPADVQAFAVLLIGVSCVVFICFLAYLTARK